MSLYHQIVRSCSDRGIGVRRAGGLRAILLAGLFHAAGAAGPGVHPHRTGARGRMPGAHGAAAQAPAPAGRMPPIPQLPVLPKEAAPPVAVIGVLERAGSDAEFHRRAGRAGGYPAAPSRARRRMRRSRRQIQAEQAAYPGPARQSERCRARSPRAGAARPDRRDPDAKFEERNQAIQNSGQAALSQIEAELIAIIRQEARGPWHEPGSAPGAGGV